MITRREQSRTADVDVEFHHSSDALSTLLALSGEAGGLDSLLDGALSRQSAEDDQPGPHHEDAPHQRARRGDASVHSKFLTLDGRLQWRSWIQ